MSVRRAAATLCALAVAGSATPLRAAVDDHLGQPIVSVRFLVEGRETTDVALIEVVETGIGRPLSMADVRESIRHLFNLRRFEEVLVDASPSGPGVALRYDLVPLHPVTEIAFEGRTGAPGIDTAALRRAVIDRGGRSPAVGRAGELAQVVRGVLTARGYLSPSVAPRADVFHDPDRTTLVFTIDPGPRALLGTIQISGTPAVPPAELLGQLDLRRGQPYEPDSLDARIQEYVAGQRDRGYFEAKVSPVPSVNDDGRRVDLELVVERGRRVRVAFAGDPLPAERLGDLVPFQREGSVDEDLLEDSTARIEALLRAQGHRDATAPYRRDESADELVVTFDVRKGPLYVVARVDIAGNASKPRSALAPALLVRTGLPLSDAALDADIAALTELYRRDGFAAVSVEASVEPIAGAQGSADVPVTVRLVVDEGVRTVVGSVSFAGVTALSEAARRQGLGLEPGRPFVLAELAADRETLRAQYAIRGFANAVVEATPEYSADGARADVLFAVREGTQLLVGHVLVAGNRRIKRATILREVPLGRGDPLSREAEFEIQQRLSALGLFRRVRVEAVESGDESYRDLVITVEEAPATTLAVGGGVEGRRRVVGTEGGGTDERLELVPRASFEIGRRNLFGSNRSANLFTSASAPLFDRSDVTESSARPVEYRIVGTFREPNVFGVSADAAFNVTIEQQIRTSFNYRRQSVSAEMGRRLTRTLSVSGGYQLQRTDVFDVNPEDQRLIDRVFSQVRISSISASIIRDTRDDEIDPGRGEYFSANAQLAAQVIGSEVGFVKSFFRATAFRTLPGTRHVVFAANASLGLAKGFTEILDPSLGPVRDLPQSERFYAGGDTTVRGFLFETLGVRHTPPQLEDTIDKDGFPLGGNGLTIFNAELRVPWRSFQGVGFVDTGNVFRRVDLIEFAELRTAVGFGVRYNSPLGPIRVDVGFKVRPRPDETPSAWFISFGQAF
jgi:outer membrane protein assembly complex protein YaeT